MSGDEVRLSVSSLTTGDVVRVSVNGRWVGDLHMKARERETWDLLFALAGRPLERVL